MRGRLAMLLIVPVALAGVMIWPSGASPARAQTAAVTIQGFSFQPANMTVSVGTTVTWTNQDTVAHTSTSDTSSAVSWDSGAIAHGASYSVTFTQAGTFPYHCTYHPNMHGTITVEAAAAATSTPAASTSTATAATATSVPLAAYPVRAGVQSRATTATVKATEAGGRYVFAPKTRTVTVGTRVIWRNVSDAPHTVTSRGSNWSMDRMLAVKATVSHVFRKTGVYHFYCKYHPGMVGTIKVTAHS